MKTSKWPAIIIHTVSVMHLMTILLTIWHLIGVWEALVLKEKISLLPFNFAFLSKTRNSQIKRLANINGFTVLGSLCNKFEHFWRYYAWEWYFSGTPFSGILSHKITELVAKWTYYARVYESMSRIVKIVHNLEISPKRNEILMFS